MVAKYGKDKMEANIYDRVARVYVDNPKLQDLKKDIIKWSTISEVED